MIDNNWCRNGDCPCPIREYVNQQVYNFTIEEIASELTESKTRIKTCLANLLELDAVCQDGELWYPDNPF